MNVINVAGNAVGIFVFKAGVAGVAVAQSVAFTLRYKSGKWEKMNIIRENDS